ncbi:hypothetical protein LMG29542_07725 [Paraburkholderia humisilvae]|uniref:Uncharacterized protein n=1 Tax=Paraburkholderia humisilvae TaxID=627669 RepID=A0A6J5F640_9BURK|nr:hypothetical protein LMG29542_07725 [Paraburkholderia humisilvae]
MLQNKVRAVKDKRREIVILGKRTHEGRVRDGRAPTAACRSSRGYPRSTLGNRCLAENSQVSSHCSHARLPIARPARLKARLNPAGQTILPPPGSSHGHPGALEQQGAKIVVTLFDNAAQLVLPTTVLFGNEPQPRSKLARIAELAGVSDCGDRCRRSRQPDAEHFHDTPCIRIIFGMPGNLAVELVDPVIDLTQPRPCTHQCTTCQPRNLVPGVPDSFGQPGAELVNALW